MGWDANPLPPNQSLKPPLPQESGEEIPTIGSQHSLNTLEKIKRHLVTVLTLKGLETVFAYKELVKTAILFRKISLYVFLFFFLSKYFLSSHGANSRFFENTPLHGSSHCPEKPRGWQWWAVALQALQGAACDTAPTLSSHLLFHSSELSQVGRWGWEAGVKVTDIADTGPTET